MTSPLRRRSLLRGAAAGLLAAPAAAALTTTRAAAAEPVNYPIALTNQKTNVFEVFDRTGDWSGASNWSFSPGTTNGWDDPFEIRFRETTRYGTIALMTAGVPGNGRAGIVQVTGKPNRLDRGDLIWEASISSYPHCIERIPNVAAVVVAGTRDRIHVFGGANSDHATLREVQTITDMPKPHAVLWDDENSLLWVTGGTVIRTYKVTGANSTARLVKYGTDITFAGNGHDLQPDYANPGKLTVTDSGRCYSLDKATRKLTIFSEENYVKSYVRHPSGEAMWTLDPTPSDAPWGGPTVYFSQGRTMTRPGAEIYKSRIVTTRFH